MKRYLIIFAVLNLFITLNMLADTSLDRADIHNQLLKIKAVSISKYKEIENTSLKIQDKEESAAFNFIMAYSPLSDIADYTTDFLCSCAKIAVSARKQLNRGSIIPDNIFYHFVVPVRVNNENLDSFRIVMYDELRERVKNMNMHDAALEINHWCHEKVTYKGSDARTSSPLATIRYSLGRCGEESTLLVAALRTVGIPARQVYTPRWAHTDDNHAWVEVWVDGKWYFMGACEPSPELNMGWFAVPSTRTMFVNTRVFGKYTGDEPVIVNSDKFSELNLIANYTKTKNLKVRVINENSKPVKASKVEIQLYNYAEFFTLAKLYTDAKGETSFKTGIGDLLIWASKGDNYGFAKANQNDTLITVQIKNKPKFQPICLTITPPAEGEPVKAEAKNAALNDKRLMYEDSVRTEYMKTFLDENKAKNLLIENKIKADNNYAEYLVKSYGNWKEIIKYITDAHKMYPSNPAIVQLLESISEKDLRDTRSDILMNHLAAGIRFKSEQFSEDIWKNYILNGRIANENMVAYRIIGDMYLNNSLCSGKKSFENAGRDSKVKSIVNYINNNIKIDTVWNTHSRAPLSPLGVYDLKISDKISRDIFFVALCRSLGIPARVNSGTGIPQYFNEQGRWYDIYFEKLQKNSDYGFISFVNKSSFEPKYYSNFTVRRYEKGGYNTIELDDIMPLNQIPDKFEVPAGKYMLVTGNRTQSGEVYSAISFFNVQKGKISQVDVKVPDLPKSKNAWAVLNGNNYSILPIYSTEAVSLHSITKDKPYILAVIEADKEPTKHIMADLPALKSEIEGRDMTIIFILDKSKTHKDFTPEVFKGLPKNSLFAWDIDNNILKEIELIRKEKLSSTLPVVIYGNPSGELLYFNKGYKIGIIDEILRSTK